MPYAQIRMLEGILAARSLGWVEAEHLAEQIDGKWVCVWVELLEGDAWLNRKRANIVLSLNIIVSERVKYVLDDLKLTRGDPTRRRASSVGVPRQLRI